MPWASSSAQLADIVYVFDFDHILGSYQVDNTRVVKVNAVSPLELKNPVFVVGSGADMLEIEGMNRGLMDESFSRDRIVYDTATQFEGKDLSEYDLIILGGPLHNAYTRHLLDEGVLTYSETDVKMPGMVIEVINMPSGHTALVMGDVAGYTYNKKDLPLESIIPEEMAPAAAVVLGGGLGILGILLGKLQGAFSSLFNRIWEFISGYFTTHAQEAASEKEMEMRKVKAEKRKNEIMGFSYLEIFVTLLCAVIFGLAYVLADRSDLLPANIALYIVVAGVATIAHDIAHRALAYKFKTDSEYKFWGLGTVIMFLTSWLFGSVFAQPARTIIDKDADVSAKDMALITLSGPIVSLVLSLGFLLLVPLGGLISTVGILGFSMNMLSTVYSLMPFEPMDGKKIYEWSKAFWALIFIPLLLFYLVMTMFIV